MMKTKSLTLLAVLAIASIASAGVIQPVSVVSEEYVLIGANQTINNAGMNTPVNGGDSTAAALAATHTFGGTYNQSYVSTDPGGWPSDFFASLGVDTDIDLVFDLTGGGDTTIGSAILWQYENNGGGPDNVGNNAYTLEIRVNTEAEGSDVFAGAATMITMVTTTDLGGVNSAQAFALDTIVDGRFVQLSITDNYYGIMDAGGDRVGLGEVRFASEAIPEPATMALLSLGALLIRRRR